VATGTDTEGLTVVTISTQAAVVVVAEVVTDTLLVSPIFSSSSLKRGKYLSYNCDKNRETKVLLVFFKTITMNNE